MKIFPYILARIGGLPFNYMENISWINKEELEKYYSRSEAMQAEKKQLLSNLLKVINKIEEYPAKFYLKILRRDVFNNRNLKIKPFEYEGAIQEEFYAVIEQVKQYKTRLDNWEKELVKFETFYIKEEERSRSILQQNKLSESIGKGLQLASHSLLDRFKNYQSKGAGKVNKKILQTERTLLQYLSRAASKTSPFSSFTKVGIIDFKNELRYEAKRKVRLNNSLFALLRDALVHYPPFYKQLRIRLNPAIIKSFDGSEADSITEWKFLLNTKNIESIQHLENSGLIKFVIESLSNDKADFTYSSFVEMLSENVESDSASLEQFLSQLINYGLIEWNWPFSGLDPYWPFKLENLLISYSMDDLLVELQQSLIEVKAWMKHFEKGDFNLRKEVQRKAFDRLQYIAEKFLEVTSLKEVEQEATSDHLKNIFAVKFNLTKEQIFYEDVSQDAESDFSKSDFEVIAEELEQLTNLLNPFYYNSNKEKYFTFFKSNYPSGKVDLLSFYEDYFRNPIDVAPIIDQEEINKRKDYLVELMEKGNWKNLDHFHLDLSVFPVLEKKVIDQHISKAAFLQLYKTEETTKAFIDTAFMGYGKMFGRFLHLFPKELTAIIRKNNEEINNNTLWVENVDASIYNPNVHPSFLSWELKMPGSQNNLPKNNQISITDLEIRMDSKLSSLFLFDKKRNKRVVIFDFGFEALENRSPMYQLLATFNYKLVGPDILTDILDNRLTQKDKEGIIHRPRISVGNHLIIRRRGWGIPKSILPLKLNAESHASYFLRLNQWRRSLLIPKKVFITINTSDFETNKQPRSKSDDYKPQFIDFDSPLLIQLFAKLITKTKSYLKIEEMLPEPTEHFGDKENRFVCEYLLEWNTREH
jgi:lantibiotic biosynthesis dehydratase-like protein